MTYNMGWSFHNVYRVVASFVISSPFIVLLISSGVESCRYILDGLDCLSNTVKYWLNVYDSVIIWLIQFSSKWYKVFIEFISNDPTISYQLIIYHKFTIYGRVSFPPEFIDSRPSFLKIALVSSNFGVIVIGFCCSYGMF